MKKIITILGLALSAIVLSNTAFANNLIVDTVSVPQRHIRAYNTTQYAPDSLSSFVWYFIMDDSDSTAILTYPGKFHNISDPNESGFAYDTVALNRFFGWEGIWNQNMYNCWSEVIEKKSPGSNDLFYTALRIPDKFVYDGIPYTVTEIGDSAFMNSPINYINVPDSVKRIGKHAFANSKIIGQCEASPYQVIPNSVTELGEGIFQNCKNLKRIDIDASVTSIPAGTFDGCTSLSQVRFGAMVDSIECDLNTSINNSNLQIAFSSYSAPTIIGNIKASEIWYPNGADPTEYKKYSDKLFSYYIETEKDSFDIEYSKLPLKLNFTQKSYFANPNAVYNYIYYYPAGSGINFSINALTGRGANKVRFRMLFDNLDHVWQANEVYQIIRQDTATSYAYLDYNATDTVYEVTVRSLDFTRAEAKVKINVKGLIPVQRVVLTPDTNVIVNKDTVLINAGDSARIISRVVDRKNIIAYNQDVKWSSSNESIASVDEHGIVTGIAPGLAYIYATSIAPDVTNVYGAYKVLVSEPEQDSPSTPQSAGMTIENNISISTNGKELTIRSNAPLGKVDIFSIDGKLVKSLNSVLNIETVNLPSSGIYIVKTKSQSIKIRL